MKPIEFPQQNAVLAKDQPEYQPLPVCQVPDAHGTVISCWQLTWRERWQLLWSGRLWLSQLTFRQLLQPQLPSVQSPFYPET